MKKINYVIYKEGKYYVSQPNVGALRESVLFIP